MDDKLSKSLMYIADAVETGYSAVFTFGVKELLNTKERQELASVLRDLSVSQASGIKISNFNNQSRKL